MLLAGTTCTDLDQAASFWFALTDTLRGGAPPHLQPHTCSRQLCELPPVTVPTSTGRADLPSLPARTQKASQGCAQRQYCDDWSLPDHLSIRLRTHSGKVGSRSRTLRHLVQKSLKRSISVRIVSQRVGDPGRFGVFCRRITTPTTNGVVLLPVRPVRGVPGNRSKPMVTTARHLSYASLTPYLDDARARPLPQWVLKTAGLASAEVRQHLLRFDR